MLGSPMESGRGQRPIGLWIGLIGGPIVKYSFTLPVRGPLATPETLSAIARHGEELGYYSLLTGDHIVVPQEISSP